MKFPNFLILIIKALALVLLGIGILIKILHWEFGIIDGQIITVFAIILFVLGFILPKLLQKK